MRDRWDELVATFAAAWPRQQLEAAHIRAYIDGLSDLPIEEVEQAMAYAARTSKWPPSIAELRAIVCDRRLGLPEPGAALEAVEACATGRVRFDALPEPARRAVRAMGGMFSWRAAEAPGPQRTQFMRLYEEFRQDARLQVIAGELPGPRQIEAAQ